MFNIISLLNLNRTKGFPVQCNALPFFLELVPKRNLTGWKICFPKSIYIPFQITRAHRYEKLSCRLSCFLSLSTFASQLFSGVRTTTKTWVDFGQMFHPSRQVPPTHFGSSCRRDLKCAIIWIGFSVALPNMNIIQPTMSSVKLSRHPTKNKA